LLSSACMRLTSPLQVLAGLPRIMRHPRSSLERIVPLRTPSAVDVAELKRVIGEVLRPLAELEVQFVDDIPEEPNGKFRIYRSLVESEYS